MKTIMHYIKSILLVFLCLLLASCRPHDERFFLLHPEAIQPAYDKCIALTEKFSHNESNECIAVLRVIPIFKEYLDEAIKNPRAYGLNIMHSEIKLVSLQQKLAAVELGSVKMSDTELRNLKNAIDLANIEVKARLAIIRLLHK